MDSQQNFSSNSAPDQNQPSNFSPNTNSAGPAPFPPSSFGAPQAFGSQPAQPVQPSMPSSQFPRSVNEAFNVPSQPASFNQPSVSRPGMTPTTPAAFSPTPTSAPVPPSAAPEIGIRTMQSDAESLRTTGGAEAMPQVFAPAAGEPNEPVFNPDVVDLSAGKPGQPKKSNKGLIIAILGIVLLAGLFFVFKYLLLPKMCPTPVVAPCPAPVVEQPAVMPVPVPGVVQPAPVPARTHISYFTVPADQTETVTLAAADLQNIKDGLAKIPAEKIKPSSLVEVVFNNATGPIIFADYMTAVFPNEWMTADLQANFKDDFTVFVYYDASSKPFPGFVAQVKPEVADGAPKTLGAKIETSKQLANLFLTDTGNFGKFDDGSIDATKLVRFSRGSNSQKVEYGFFKSQGVTYWVVTTSYDAIKEAVKRLGV